MGNCKDCKWWKQATPQHQELSWGYCTLVEADCGRAKHGQSIAFAEAEMDADEVRLFCRQDFGCVQFEAKP